MGTTLVTGGTGFVGKALQRANPDWVYLSSKDCNLLSMEEIFSVLERHNPSSIIHLAGIVGGIKEKILAAKRANIKEIILSSYNKKDIEEIDQKYLKGLNFIYVNNMSDVISHSLTNRKVLNPKKIN